MTTLANNNDVERGTGVGTGHHTGGLGANNTTTAGRGVGKAGYAEDGYGNGPGIGHHGPVTLGADAGEQQLYQGGAGYRRFGNPAPLGLFAFATTLFVYSLVTVHTRGVVTPNIVIAMALFVGGLVQLLAGMWEFACGNTLGATTFSMYGGFWLSYAAIFIPGFFVAAGYSSQTEFAHALGFWLAAWFIFTFMMFIASLRSNAGLILFFFLLTMTFMFLMIGQFILSRVGLSRAGGGFGIAASFVAYYKGAAHLWSRESSYFSAPLGRLGGGRHGTNAGARTAY